jgi:hypothetical protein
MTENWQIVRIVPQTMQLDYIVVDNNNVFKGTEIIQKDVIFEKTADLPVGINGLQQWSAEYNGRECCGISVFFDESGWNQAKDATVGTSVPPIVKVDSIVVKATAHDQLQEIAHVYLLKKSNLSPREAFRQACLDYPRLHEQYEIEVHSENHGRA